MKISNLYALLENATTVDEEIFDVRFEEIVSLVDEEKFEEATTLITSILNEGSVDIRLIMYLFYAQFIAQGISSIKEIFPAIQTLVNTYWEQLSPINMREKHFSSGITWLLSTIGRKLKRSEKLLKSKKHDDFSHKSLSTPLDIEQLLLINQQFATFLSQKMEEPSLTQYLHFISKWIENSTIKPEPVTETPPPPEPPAPKPTSLQEILLSSEAMSHLFKKIQAFEHLIQKQEFEKAALVSDDIAHIIKSFDPSTFFPKLFTPYFSLSAEHIDTLSAEWENRGSLKWEALLRLYQTDLEEFIQW